MDCSTVGSATGKTAAPLPTNALWFSSAEVKESNNKVECSPNPTAWMCVKYCFLGHYFIAVSLNKLHTSETALHKCVRMLAYIVCLL